jgi:hypothetical protein
LTPEVIALIAELENIGENREAEPDFRNRAAARRAAKLIKELYAQESSLDSQAT